MGNDHRVVNLTMTNRRFKDDSQWGDLLERVHHGETTREDINIINLRVFGPNFALPKFEELQGADTPYASYMNSDRNLIYDNIFACK